MYNVGLFTFKMVKDYISKNKQMLETNKEIISRLKFLGRIMKGDKINTHNVSVQHDNFITSVYRTFLNQDSRENALSFIQETITRSFELLTTFERSENECDKSMCINIIHDLQRAKQGLANLKATYVSDLKFGCDMDTLLQVIDSRLQGLIVKYPIETLDIFSREEYEEKEYQE